MGHFKKIFMGHFKKGLTKRSETFDYEQNLRQNVIDCKQDVH